jgi:glycosyltransferase involved in cell wall biosynthesis
MVKFCYSWQINVSREMKISNPIVSVIIPSYNCEPYIAETINSVLNQSFKDIELIVVDDGSTDRTREIVASFGAPVRLVSQENARVSAARNRGISEAAGQYICLIDHDDYWFPHKLEQQVALLKAHAEVGVVYSAFILWHADENERFPEPSSFDLTAFPHGIDPELSGWIYCRLLLDCLMLTSTAMFRREVFEHCGNFDVNLPYSEDWDLWLRISREYPFLKQQQPTTLYRLHPHQGIRIVRMIDYRTELLIKASQMWGLCNADGRCIKRGEFRKKLAHYHAEFAYHHLQAGNVSVAAKSLVKAWLNNPAKIKYFALLVASIVGWRPK